MGITVAQLKRQVDEARKNIEPQTAKIILQFEQQILDLIRERQLYDKGIDGNNAQLKPYAPYTIALKKIKGDKYQNTTLKDTGSFYSSFQTNYGSFQLELFATDSKTSKLTEKYGDNILLLTEQNQDVLSETIIRPNLLKYLKTIFK